MNETEPRKWYQKNSGIILLLFLFFPAGLYLMWKYSKWNKPIKTAISAFIGILVIFILLPKAELQSITISIPDYQHEYDINSEIPVDISIEPESAASTNLKYIVSDDSISFSSGQITTGSSEGSYDVYVQADGIQSNVITINVVDITAREKAEKEAEEKRLADEQAAKEAEEKAAAEADAQRLAEEQAEKEQIEKEAATEASTSTTVTAAATESQSSSSSSESNESGDGNNFSTYDNAQQQDTSEDYVLNTSTMKFHYPSCSSVKKIAPQNYETSNSSRDELISQGYSPCGKCKP